MSSIKLKHSGGNSVSLNPPTSAPTSSDVAFKLPNADGSARQFMTTDGSGNLAFASYPQVFHSRATGDQDVTASYADISGCVLTGITPRSANSKFLITGNIYMNLNSSTGIRIRMIKTVGGSDTVIYEQRNTYAIYQSAGGDHEQNVVTFLDSPSTTDTIGYKFQVIEYDTDSITLNQGDFSSITVQEYLG